MKSGSSYGVSLPLYSARSHYKSGLKPSPSFNNYSGNNSDRESVTSSARSKRIRPRKNSNGSIKITKTMSKKIKGMDYTNYNYNTAVSRLKLLLAESYTPNKQNFSYSKNLLEDSGEDTDNQSADRPVLSEISKYLSPSYSTRGPRGITKKYKPFSPSLAKENMTIPKYSTTSDYLTAAPIVPVQTAADSIQAPTEILSFIEKQEDYIEQLEKESKFCRNELSHLLGKVKDVISENEALTEHARSDLAKISHHDTNHISNSSESDDLYRRPLTKKPKSPRSLSGPNIVFESRISELEAELAQSGIDLHKMRAENDELKRKIASGSASILNCELHRKQIESLQKDKAQLEEHVRRLEKTIDELKSEGQYSTSKRHLSDMAIIERSQQDIEIKHLRDELDRQHERVRELQHEMARRVSEERTNAERRYNLQVDQLGGDLNNQWEQVSKLQMDLERQKRIESDMKRDASQRNAQIEELKQELKTKRSSFLSDIAQVNAEKQSLEQEITSLRLQLDRADRQAKIEAARLNAEINSLRQRLDRADADVLHAKRENLRLSDEIASLEKEVTLGEMKNELRPTRKDLDKSIQEMQEKHAGTVVELEDMIQNQRQLMDKLTNECKTLTNKLEDTSLNHKMEIAALQSNVEFITNRVINNDRIGNSPARENINSFSSSLPQSKAPIEYESPLSTSDNRITSLPTSNAARESSFEKPESLTKPYEYKSSVDLGSSIPATTMPSSIRPTTTAPVESTLRDEPEKYSAFDYGRDNENKKDIFSNDETYGRNGTNNNTPLRSSTTAENSIAYDTSQQLLGEDAKLYGTKDSDITRPGTDDLQSYEQTPATDYSQYQAEGYEGYDPQQYDTTGYEGYEQQYDGTQQYEGTGQYDDQQYQEYGQDYDQTYQPEISSYDQLQQAAPSLVQQQQSQIQQQQQLQQPSLQSSISTAGAIPTTAQSGPTVNPAKTTGKPIESRPQPRTGGSLVGPPNASGAVGGGGEKGATILPQQSAQRGPPGGISKN